MPNLFSYSMIRLIIVLLALAMLLSACISETPAANSILISQVMGGEDGNNNHEFIELYNPAQEFMDINGWALYYRLPTSDKDLIVYRWREQTLIPGNGHYLLIRAGEKFSIQPDAEFEQSINLFDGGLVLKRADGSLSDALGWGKAPIGFFEGNPAPALENGSALERLPGKERGNTKDSNHNARDFILTNAPTPHNTGSAPLPPDGKRLAIQVDFPASVEPGTKFDLKITVSNPTNEDAREVLATIPFPSNLKTPTLPQGVKREDSQILWNIPALSKTENRSLTIQVQVPFSYGSFYIRGYRAQAENLKIAGFGRPLQSQIEGGVIPIGVARNLNLAELTIEGTATMYTGGYFAGNNNNKFYLQDDTGGIQVQVFGGQGQVNVKIGDRVRVRGKIDNYRDAMEIVPIKVPSDIQILEKGKDGSGLSPLKVPLAQAASDRQNLPGRLIQVEGKITRIEELAYNFDLSLSDGNGSVLSLYLDKQTNVSIDLFEIDQIIQAVGILEGRDGKWMLYPRQQEDLQPLFTDPLRIEVNLPTTVSQNEPFTVSFKVTNNTDQILKNLLVKAPIPANSFQIESVLDNGKVEGNQILWNLLELTARTSRTVRYIAKPSSSSGQISIQNYSVEYTGLKSPITGASRYTFIASGVPIWAIQGSGFRSPYTGSTLTTQGIVTGIFPALGGFWIQNPQPDNDPKTSEGLFINFSLGKNAIKMGDLVEVSGVIRETNSQTSLMVENSSGVKTVRQDQTIPEPVELDPPDRTQESEVYFESLEGMLVKVSGPARAVAPTSHYGEYVIITPRHPEQRIFQGQDNGFAIMVDDGSNVTYGDSEKLPYKVRTGDQISNLVGPLAYTYSRYKLEPVQNPRVTTGPIQTRSIPPAENDEISIMTWNTLNLFDLVDPHPSDLPRLTTDQYRRDLRKVAATIQSAGAPAVVGLQEVENLRVLEDIAKQDVLSGYAYKPVLIEGTDSRGIDVGYLVRSDQVKILESKAYPDTSGLFSRPPLLLRVQTTAPRAASEFWILNNHFLSMSAGVEATEARRVGQANWNVRLIKEIQEKSPNARVALLGDLNSFYKSPPVDTLRNTPLRHVFEWLPDSERYTYIYQGESQVLDHIMITPNLVSAVKRVEILHVNADFPPQDPQDESPFGKSDHDPVVVTITLNP